MHTVVLSRVTERGPAGLYWVDDEWAVDTNYGVNNAISHNGSSYRVIVEHLSTENSEPGVGSNWNEFWEVLALGSNTADFNIVADIADEIEVVANNILAIQAASTAANTATTKAAEASASAITAAAATQVRYSPGSIYNNLGVSLGGYSCELYAFRATLQSRIVGKIRQSGAGASVTFYYAVNEVMVAGPFTATDTTPVNEVVSFSVPIGSEVRMHITAMSGNVTEFETASYGSIA